MTKAFKDKHKTVGEATMSAMRGVFYARGFDNARILTDWNEIVGEELAMQYKPAKIVQTAARNIVLYLYAVSLRDRQYITYNKRIILEKLNLFLGHDGISDVKLINH